jgi:hypothetical protein
MTTSRFAPRWTDVLRGAAAGAAATAGVGLVVLAAAWVVGRQTADEVVGANIGLGLAALGVRLVATPLAGWWALRRWGVPAAGGAAAIGTAVYLAAAVAGPFDAAPPAAVAGWLLGGALAGAVGVYLAGALARGRAAASA